MLRTVLVMVVLLLTGHGVAAAATAPSPPQSIWVTTCAETSLVLTWYDAIAGTNPIASYQVHRNGVQVATPTTTTWSDSGLAGGTTYTYTVIAVDSSGLTSTASVVLTAVTLPVGSQNPTAPSGLTGSAISGTQVSLTWNAVPGSISRYIVSDGSRVVGTSSTPSCTCIVAPSPGSGHSFSVVAETTQGFQSPASAAYVVTMPADTLSPTAPTDVVIDGTTSSAVRLHWTAATDETVVSGYQVSWTGSRGDAGTFNTTDTAVVLGVETSQRLLPGSTYAITVATRDIVSHLTAAWPVSASTPVDTAAPTTPTSPTLVSTSYASVVLRWSNDGDDVGVTAWDVIRNGVTIATATTTTYTDSTVLPGTNYAYAIIAKDAAGLVSAASDTLQIATPTETVPPPAPVGVRLTGRTATSLTLDWQQDADGGGSGFHHWSIERNGTIVAASVTVKPWTDTSPIDSGETYVIRAVDACGNASMPSDPCLAQRAGDTQAPTAPNQPTAAGITTTAVTLSWTGGTDNVAVVGYDVYRDGLRVGDALTPTWSDAGQVPGSTHSYQVRAYDAVANRSPLSVACSVTMTTDASVPTTPAGLAAQDVRVTSVLLTWAASTDNIAVAAYEVLRGGVVVATVADVSWCDSGLTPVTSYSYGVRAVDVAGNRSPVGAAVPVTTLADTTPPDAVPRLLATGLTSHDLTLRWSAGSDDVGVVSYEVRRDGAIIGTQTSTMRVDSALQDATSYSYTVIAIDAAGNRSLPSPALVVVTPVDPAIDRVAPTVPQALTLIARRTPALFVAFKTSFFPTPTAPYDARRVVVPAADKPREAA